MLGVDTHHLSADTRRLLHANNRQRSRLPGGGVIALQDTGPAGYVDAAARAYPTGPGTLYEGAQRAAKPRFHLDATGTRLGSPLGRQVRINGPYLAHM